MFALLAFFGDVGCALGPSVVSRVATEKGNFNIGLLAAGIFPLLLFVLLLFIPSKQAKIEK